MRKLLAVLAVAAVLFGCNGRTHDSRYNMRDTVPAASFDPDSVLLRSIDLRKMTHLDFPRFTIAKALPLLGDSAVDSTAQLEPGVENYQATLVFDTIPAALRMKFDERAARDSSWTAAPDGWTFAWTSRDTTESCRLVIPRVGRKATFTHRRI